MNTGGYIRIAHLPDLYYTISQLSYRLCRNGQPLTTEDARLALSQLVERGVAEAITVREAYGQTHARLAYRLSPRISIAELNTLIGDTTHA